MTLVTAAFLILLTLTLIGIWLLLQGRYLRAEQYRRVQVATHLIEEMSQQPLQDGNILRLARIADDSVSGDAISRVMICDRTGAVVADSDHEAYGQKPRMVARALRSQSEVVATRPDYWWGAVAVRNDIGQVLGGIMVRFPAQSLVRAQRRTQTVGLLMALAGIALGSGLAFFAARIMTQPLERLLQGIRRLQAGQVAEPVPASGGPELAEIGRAFNEMSSAVGERVRRLELLNQLAASLPLARDLQGIVSAVRTYVQSITGAESFVWVADPFSRILTPVTAEEGEYFGESIPVTSDSAVGKAFMERRMIVIGRGEDLPPGSSMVSGLSVESAVVLPLITRDGVVGVLAMAYPGDRQITKEDMALAWMIGNTGAPVITAMLRAEAQSRTAAALQALLVPAQLPDIGIDLWAVYTPAEEMAGLGGDYYDLIPLGNSRWCIVVGDTSGKGLEAARHTATAKYVIRSYILEYGDPADALYWSNRALVLQEQAGKFITVFCGVLRTTSGSITYANAGHIPPLIFRRSTGQVEFPGGQGPVLGAFQGQSYKDNTLQLQSGDLFCVYTDGITEARRGREWFGDGRLAEVVVENAERSAGEICETIVQEVRDFSGTRLKDDVVLMVLKMP